MKSDIIKILTPTGAKRLHLRVWDYGPTRLSFNRRFKTMAALTEKIKELEAKERELFQPDLFGSVGLTMGDLHDQFTRIRAAKFSPGWQLNLKQYWKMLGPRLSAMKPSQVTAKFLHELDRELVLSGNSQRTANIKTGFICAILNHALRTGTITAHPALNFKKAKVSKTKTEFWEREDAEDFLDFAARKYPRNSPDRYIFVIYLLALNSGLRAGEIWALKPRCLKDVRCLLRVEEQFDRVSKSCRETKGRGPRDVPLNAVLAEELHALIMQQQIGRNEFIFRTASKTPIDHDNFRYRIFDREFGKNEDQWSGPKIKFHALRHTAATLMLSSGVDVRTLQEILGHEDIKTTIRYVHALAGNVERVAKQFCISPKSDRRLRVVGLDSSEDG